MQSVSLVISCRIWNKIFSVDKAESRENSAGSCASHLRGNGASEAAGRLLNGKMSTDQRAFQLTTLSFAYMQRFLNYELVKIMLVIFWPPFVILVEIGYDVKLIYTLCKITL